ncbi:MAG: SGNH/GDSL hydrolase family protein [Opitutales bacterium]|nr:SGNH/GDSL hydrolase family protein [Opitutales bacterium]
MRIFILLLFVPSLGVTAETAEEAWSSLLSENFKKREAFAFVENDSSLPNVFIYGDSISIAYTPAVRSELEGEANVYRLHVNGGDSSSIIQKVDTLRRMMKDHWDFEWDVIQFNVGLHDLKYVAGRSLDKAKGEQVTSMAEYEANLRNAIGYFVRIAPNAKLIFATTTPVPKGEPGRHVIDAGRYNRVALRVLRDYPEIEVNDLYAFTLPNQPEWWTKPGNVHFNEVGYTAQGKEVARYVREALGK